MDTLNENELEVENAASKETLPPILVGQKNQLELYLSESEELLLRQEKLKKSIVEDLNEIEKIKQDISSFCRNKIHLFSHSRVYNIFASEISNSIDIKTRKIKILVNSSPNPSKSKKINEIFLDAKRSTSFFVAKLKLLLRSDHEEKVMVRLMNFFPSAAILEINRKISNRLSECTLLLKSLENKFSKSLSYFQTQNDGIKGLSLAKSLFQNQMSEYIQVQDNINSSGNSIESRKQQIEKLEIQIRQTLNFLKNLDDDNDHLSAMLNFIKSDYKGAILVSKEKISKDLKKLEIEFQKWNNIFKVEPETFGHTLTIDRFRAIKQEWIKEQRDEYKNLLEEDHWNIDEKEVKKVIDNLHHAEVKINAIFDELENAPFKKEKTYLIPEFICGYESILKIQTEVKTNLILILKLWDSFMELEVKTIHHFKIKGNDEREEALNLSWNQLELNWIGYRRGIRNVNAEISAGNLERATRFLKTLATNVRHDLLELQNIEEEDFEFTKLLKFMEITKKGSLISLRYKSLARVQEILILVNNFWNCGYKNCKEFQNWEEVKLNLDLAKSKILLEMNSNLTILESIDLEKQPNARELLLNIYWNLNSYNEELKSISFLDEKTLLEEFMMILPSGTLMVIRKNVREQMNEITRLINTLLTNWKSSPTKLTNFNFLNNETAKLEINFYLVSLKTIEWCASAIKLSNESVGPISEDKICVKISEFKDLENKAKILLNKLAKIDEIKNNLELMTEVVNLNTKINFDFIKKNVEIHLRIIENIVNKYRYKEVGCPRFSIDILSLIKPGYWGYQKLFGDENSNELSNTTKNEKYRLAKDILIFEEKTWTNLKAIKVFDQEMKNEELSSSRRFIDTVMPLYSFYENNKFDEFIFKYVVFDEGEISNEIENEIKALNKQIGICDSDNDCDHNEQLINTSNNTLETNHSKEKNNEWLMVAEERTLLNTDISLIHNNIKEEITYEITLN